MNYLSSCGNNHLSDKIEHVFDYPKVYCLHNHTWKLSKTDFTPHVLFNLETMIDFRLDEETKGQIKRERENT